jgi:hypothetical protein
LRLAAPRRLAAALAAAAPSEDTLTLLPTEFVTARGASCAIVPRRARYAEVLWKHQRCTCRARRSRTSRLRRVRALRRAEIRSWAESTRARDFVCARCYVSRAGRRGVSSEGAAAASAAARRRVQRAARRSAGARLRAGELSKRIPRADRARQSKNCALHKASARDAPVQTTYQQRAEDAESRSTHRQRDRQRATRRSRHARRAPRHSE